MGKPGRLLSSAAIIAGLSLLAKLLGFFRDQVIAAQFGTSSVTDAYLVGITIPTQVANVMIVVVGTASVPVLAAYAGRGDWQGTWASLRRLARPTVAVAVLIAAVGALLAPVLVTWIAPEFDVVQREMAVQSARIAFGSVAFLGMSALLQAALNNLKAYTVSALAPVIGNLLMVVMVWFLADWNAAGLSTGLFLGAVVQFAVMVLALRGRGFRWKGALGSSRDITQAGGTAWILLLGAIVGQLWVAVDRHLAAGLPTGSVAALAFAEKIRLLPLGLVTPLLGFIVYPILAEYGAKADHRGLATTMERGLNLLALLLLPLSTGLIILREPIVRLAFERGSFDADATALTAVALAAYSAGILGIAVITLVGYGFNAIKRPVIPFWITVVASTLNVLLAYGLVGHLESEGLALANTLAQSVGGLLALILFARWNSDYQWKHQAIVWAKTFVACVLMGLVTSLSANAIGLMTTAHALETLLQLVLVIGLGAVTYGVVLWLLRVEEFRSFAQWVIQRTFRLRAG